MFQVSKFRVLRSQILLNRENATNVVKATVALHNFLIREDRNGYISLGDVDSEGHEHEHLPGRYQLEVGEPHATFPLNNVHGNRTGTTAARAVRESVADFFMTEEGSVSWQERYAHVK